MTPHHHLDDATVMRYASGTLDEAFTVVVASHLLILMVVDHEDWLVRSYRNRWAFRDVPSVRGSLLDRFDRVLVADEPSFELSCVYERFRILHPVGAAVHGATLWSRSIGNEVRYRYDHRHLLLVKVDRLGDLLRAMEAENLSLEHIHDY